MAVTWRGHTVWTDERFYAHCSCGYRSTLKAVEDAATAAALNHLWRETVAPEFKGKRGRMEHRHGDTMSRNEFMRALEQQQRASA